MGNASRLLVTLALCLAAACVPTGDVPPCEVAGHYAGGTSQPKPGSECQWLALVGVDIERTSRPALDGLDVEDVYRVSLDGECRGTVREGACAMHITCDDGSAGDWTFSDGGMMGTYTEGAPCTDTVIMVATRTP